MRPASMGIFSAILASLCCLGPVALVLLGLGTLGAGAFLGRYHWFFIGGAALILIYAWRLYLKEKRRCEAARCQMEGRTPARITLIIATVAALSFAALNVYTYVIAAAPESAARPSHLGQWSQVEIPVKGLVCFTCELVVESSVKNLNGVAEAKASVKRGSVTVKYDPQRIKVEEIVAAIDRTGYRAELPKKSDQGPNPH